MAFALGSCSKRLDLQPRNKIPGDVVLTDPNGIKAFVADLYYQAPIEDFVYFPREGFNARGNTGSMSLSQYGLEAIHSEWPNFNEFNNGWWGSAYKLNRNINVLIEALPNLDINDADKKTLLGEASFLRAYTYFGLAKRYGGVSIITTNQVYTSDFESLRVPRSTEKETWDFILAECDKAIANLPETRESNDETKRRATKWGAYALKSRAALYAASVAKHWSKAPLSGEAVDKKLVGLDMADANRYYQECITAADAVISSGKFSLYGANPGSVANAIGNLKNLFTDPNVAPQEVIFMKGYGK
ncbi:RagB/SusD family nutrient uptake outer membrane protein [Haoranjiania flava]|uniref:RagB/SusD family nutrient uptake outer membrane protein n=1 Tax=Haoranjiania flava TaxID=1856322 RepID=A0AAE3LKG5_9BACT|nr:RagB/SusD family nutrient uptake outer membrane protein [Haoranjiania flava]MCU7694573.1 RagB/SusD family nutrient uptake outer membrane protein [Haoranjiania flava]